MPGTTVPGHLNSRPVFKWWSESWYINQMVIRIPNYHDTGHLNSKPLNNGTTLHDLITELVCYSDPHCIKKFKFNLDLSGAEPREPFTSSPKHTEKSWGTPPLPPPPPQWKIGDIFVPFQRIITFFNSSVS